MPACLRFGWLAPRSSEIRNYFYIGGGACSFIGGEVWKWELDLGIEPCVVVRATGYDSVALKVARLGG